MDYGPAGRRKRSCCGQNVDLKKGLNQLNSSSGPNLYIITLGMSVLPLLPALWVVFLPSILFFHYSITFYSVCLLNYVFPASL